MEAQCSPERPRFHNEMLDSSFKDIEKHSNIVNSQMKNDLEQSENINPNKQMNVEYKRIRFNRSAKDHCSDGAIDVSRLQKIGMTTIIDSEIDDLIFASKSSISHGVDENYKICECDEDNIKESEAYGLENENFMTFKNPINTHLDFNGLSINDNECICIEDQQLCQTIESLDEDNKNSSIDHKEFLNDYTFNDEVGIICSNSSIKIINQYYDLKIMNRVFNSWYKRVSILKIEIPLILKYL